VACSAGAPIADDAIMRGYREACGSQDSDAPRGSPRPLPADCPICFEEITEQGTQKTAVGDAAAETCRSCGHHLHTDCQRRWAATSPMGDRCPLCRSPWSVPDAQTTGDKVLVNLAGYSSQSRPSLQELYPETHQWITNRST